jgi:alkanesulfonate monooxygenase SsuD/methylene tetrahydromethanopterin reductase-like flavin-dependent oxidoreductase (luciferase family)
MRFGVSVATHILNADLAAHAEAAGLDSFYGTDSQMIWSDVYSYLALAATKTERIRLGPLVAVTPTRLAPVTAQSIATINALAPGRTVLALGTAHTAMRTMGQEPMGAAAFGEYLRVVRALLHDEEVEYERDGSRRWIRFMQRELDMVRLEPPVPVYVSGFGPRTQRLAAVLEPGEPVDADPVVEAVGPLLVAGFHTAWHAYQHDPSGFVPPLNLAPGWEEYLSIIARRGVPEDRQYIDIHEGHGTVVRDDERVLVTRELIKSSAIVGEPDEVIERLRAVQAAGVTEFILRIGYTNAPEMITRFCRYVKDRM